jgi:hypothetical protein
MRENEQPNMRRALKTLPATPEDAYREIMNRIKNAGEHTPRTAFRTLAWIFRAARPLQMDELREALAVHEVWSEDEEIINLQYIVKQYSVTGILKNCQSLVIHDTASGVVRFTHPTVQPFLATQDLPQVSELAMTCLTYLGFDGFNQICDNIESLEKRIQSYKFYQYAAQFWGAHTKGEAENSENIQQAIVKFLSSKNKRNSMFQAAKFGERGDTIRDNFTKRQTLLLHIVAKEGLGTISNIIFKRYLARNDGYVLAVTLLKVLRIGRMIQS